MNVRDCLDALQVKFRFRVAHCMFCVSLKFGGSAAVFSKVQISSTKRYLFNSSLRSSRKINSLKMVFMSVRLFLIDLTIFD